MTKIEWTDKTWNPAHDCILDGETFKEYPNQ